MMPRLTGPLLAVALLLSGCCLHAPQLALTPGSYPGTLASPSELPSDFLWRQRLTATYGDREDSFDVVLQKRGDELVLIGLTPFGTKAFVLTQTGTTIAFQPLIDQAAPFPPRFVLLDIHRAYFPALPGPSATRPDGEHRAEVDGEEVVETWAGGRLQSRRFRRLDATPPGDLVVRYLAWSDDGLDPLTVVLDNGWFGYRLGVETVERRAL